MRLKKLMFTVNFYLEETSRKIGQKVISLPGIREIYWRYSAYRMYRSMQNMGRHQRNAVLRQLEPIMKQIHLLGELDKLQRNIIAENPSESLFREAKNDVLNSEAINETQYKELKKWIQNIDSREKDFSQVQKFMNQLMNELVNQIKM